MPIRNKRAFTLVEMLMVIAIIAMLAALLLPAMQNALYSSYAISCKSNMRGVSLGWQTWVGDNNNTLPPGATGESDSNWNRRGITKPNCNEFDPSCPFTAGLGWVALLQSHLGLGRFGRTNVAESAYWSLSAQDQSGILSCPAAAKRPLYLTGVQYGLNEWNIAGRNSYGIISATKLSDFYAPSKKVILMDTDKGGSGSEPGAATFTGYGGSRSIDFSRHQTSFANSVYADGHVGQWSMEEYMLTTGTTGYKTEAFGYGRQKGSPH